MDQQLPTNQPAPTPISVQPTQVARKRDWTALTIIVIFLVAAFFTTATYFLVAQKTPKNKPAVSVTPAPLVDAEKAQWKTYTDIIHNYSFFYPETWVLTTASNNHSKFTLRYSNPAKPGVLEGNFLSKEEFAKLNPIGCRQQDNTQTKVCQIYKITSLSDAYLLITLAANKPTFENALITRPQSQGISIKITEPNFDSHQTLAIILDTLKFTGETRLNKIQICPESFSADKKTAIYHSVTFPIEDIDQEFIKTDCKK